MKQQTATQFTINVPPTHEVVYEKIRELLLEGSFAPGEKLNEVQIAQSFGVSRGPIREAFQQLVTEGFLVSQKNRGVFVVEITPEDVTDIYFARNLIEREAFVRLQKFPDHDVFSQLEHFANQMHDLTNVNDWQIVTKCDMDFHWTVVQTLNSKRVSDFYSTIISQIMLCISNLRQAYKAPAEIADEHLQLLALLQHGDKKSLIKELDLHMNSAVHYLINRDASV